MIRNLLLASVVVLGASGAAMAQDGPRLVGGNGGGGPEVVYDTGLPANVVGSAQVTMTGGDRERTFHYGRTTAVPGRLGTLVGGGRDAHVVYADPANATGLDRIETSQAN